MKTIRLLLIALSFFFISKSIYSQCTYCYSEQNSGVTTSLNSVCTNSAYSYPTQVWVCGSNGTVLKTNNQGNNWINVSGNIPSNVNLTNINCAGTDTALTTGNIGALAYVYRTTNGGANWNFVFTQQGGIINAIYMKSSLIGFMTGNPVAGRWSLWKTTNDGLGWDSSGLYLPQAGSETGWYNSLEVINNNIWFGTNNSRIYRSTNYGLNWIAMPTAPEVNSYSMWHFGFDSTFCFFGGSNLYNSTNGGLNWAQANCPGTGDFKGFCVGPIGAYTNIWYGPLFTLRTNSNVYLTWGNYINFQTDYTAPSGNYNHLAYNNVGMYNNPPIYSWAVRSNGGITMMLTGRGGEVRPISSEIPKAFNLEQNYPNPFNPVTQIRFDITKAGLTTIKIYDILGREVATVVNEQLHAGIYETTFDAGNIASGIYYYTLINGSNIQTKKMVVVK